MNDFEKLFSYIVRAGRESSSPSLTTFCLQDGIFSVNAVNRLSDVDDVGWLRYIEISHHGRRYVKSTLWQETDFPLKTFRKPSPFSKYLWRARRAKFIRLIKQ